jgi:uncharacterized membrane protein (DUF106 family)
MFRALVAAMFLAGIGVGPARAADIPSLRTEQEARLDEIQPQIFRAQREMFRARMANDKEAIKRTAKQFNALQGEQLELLRATGQLQND